MSENAKWYVIHTYSGYEDKVVRTLNKTVENYNLQDTIQEIRVLTETVTELKDGKSKTTERKVFPNYVFIKWVKDDDSWSIIRNTRGVTGFVGPGSAPLPLTDKEVEKWFAKANETSVQLDFEVGDNVRIIGTGMDGLVGVVQSIDMEAQKVEVVVHMFGRPTPATFDFNQVAKEEV